MKTFENQLIELWLWAYETYYHGILNNYLFWLCIPFFFFLEWRFPAQERSRKFLHSLKCDFIWFLLEAVQVALVTGYIIFLESLFNEKFSWMKLTFISQLPYWLHFSWGVLLSDFLGWFHHWTRHKVPIFWDFHRLHHSQRELTLFSDQRYHVVEYFIARTLTTWPMLMVGVGSPSIVAFNLFHVWYTRFYHANVRTNLGIARYLLVTPQSHRIHHSVHPIHYDKNFGVLFSFWDRLFGTACEEYNEYPKTGLHDSEFPSEMEANHAGVLKSIWLQFWHPIVLAFRRIVRSCKTLKSHFKSTNKKS